jgi:flap endonuclease-1
MQLTTEQFVDLCILLGCDYCGTIRGIGPKKAVELIKQHKSIEVILENIDRVKYPPPDPWHYKEARRLFFEPEIANGSEITLKWSEPDEQGLCQLLRFL